MTTATPTATLIHGHAALHAEIERTQARCDRLRIAYSSADLDTSADLFDEWRTCTTRHSALIEAGLLMTSGTEEPA